MLRNSLFTAMFTLACASEQPPSAQAPASGSAPSSVPAQTPAPANAGTSVTGPLTEQEFMNLHNLSAAKRPAPTGEMIDLAGTRAYLSLPPDARAPMPGIVVIHEWWGLNDHIKYWADRLAAEGYAALAVDLYGGTVATTPEDAMAATKAVDRARAGAILEAAHAFMASDARVRAPRRGVIGWCFGGGWALSHAIATPDLDAAVIYYGRLVSDPEVLQAIEAPVLGIFATRDKSIPPATIQQFEAAMKAAKKSITILSYEAEHAFANPSSERYAHGPASDAWKQVQAFFAEHLRPEASH
jgi:carboxymethylenebutenolidase